MGKLTLREALEEYKNIYMAYRNFAERTRVEYSNDLEDFIAYLEKSSVSKVGELRFPQIERYLADLENRGFAGATRKRKSVTIRSFLKYLYQDGYRTLLDFSVGSLTFVGRVFEHAPDHRAIPDRFPAASTYPGFL